MGAGLRPGTLTRGDLHSSGDLHPRLVHRRRLAIGAFTTAAGAWGGAVALASGALDMGHDLNDRLPFASPVLGAIALTAIVAVPFSVLGVLAWHADRRVGLVAALDGALLMGWILVELAFIREISFLQPIYFGVGIAFLLVGRHDPASPDGSQTS